MNRLDEGIRATLSKNVLDTLQAVFAEMAEEEGAKQQAMRVTLEKLMESIKEMESSMVRQKDSWEKERKNLVESADAARHDEWMKKQDDVTRLQFRLNLAMKDSEKESAKRLAVEQQNQDIASLLDVTVKQKMMAKESERGIKNAATWERLSRERENAAMSKALAAAAAKQRLLKELKANAQKCMLVIITKLHIPQCLAVDLLKILNYIYTAKRDNVEVLYCISLFFPQAQEIAAGETNSSEKKLQDDWRKLLGSKPHPSDDLQVPEHTLAIEKLKLKHKIL